MKKGLLILMALLLVGIVAVFTGCTRDDKAAKKITVGVNSENPPWIFAEDGKMSGYEADILEAVSYTHLRAHET